MTDEQKAAFIMAQAACLNAGVAGMVATNMQCQAHGDSPVYDEADFKAAIDRSGCHHNAVLMFFESP